MRAEHLREIVFSHCMIYVVTRGGLAVKGRYRPDDQRCVAIALRGWRAATSRSIVTIRSFLQPITVVLINQYRCTTPYVVLVS